MFILKQSILINKYYLLLSSGKDSYKEFFVLNPHPMWIYDVDSLNFVEVNDAAIQHYDYSREEFLSMTIKDIRPKEEIPKLLESLSQEELNFEQSGIWKHRKNNGTEIYVEIISHSLGKKDDKNLRLVSAFDVTEKINTIQSLKLFSTAIEQTEDMIFITDNKGTIQFVNSALEKFTGYTQEELIDKTPRIFKSGLMPEKYYDELWSTISSGKPFKSVMINRKKNGELYTVEQNIAPLKNENSIITNFISTSRDITEKLRIEHKLKESQKRYKRLTEASFEGIAIHKEGIILEVNDVFCRLSGYNYDEVIGKNAIEFVVPESKEILIKNIQSGYEQPYEVIALRKDGTTFPCEIIGKNVIEGDKKYRISAVRDLTEKKKAQEKLMRIQERYHLLFQQSLEAIYLYNFDEHRILDANDTFLNFLGYTRDEISKLSVLDFIAHENADIQNAMEKILREGKYYIGERKWKRKDGKIIDVDTTGSVITSEKENIFFITARDITERKKAEQTLKENEEKYRNLAEVAPDSIFLVNTNFEIEFINTFGAKLFNADESNIIGRKIKDIFSGGVGERATGNISKVFQSGERLYVEAPFYFGDKTTWLGTWLSPLKEESGNVIAVQGISRDITLRVLTEQALKISEERYRNIFQLAPVGIYQSTIDGKIITANKSFADILGYNSIDELLKIDFSKDLYFNTEDRETLLQQYYPYENIMDFELRWKRKDGTPIWVQITSQVVRDERGNIQYFEAFARDITQQKLADQFMKESLREKETLLKEIHHRVKNNLQVISSLLKLQSSYIKDPDDMELFKDSQNRVQSMSLIHQMLYKSKSLANINIKDYIGQIIQYLRLMYKHSSQRVTFDLDVDEVNLNIDTAIPCGLLINEMISNCFKHAFPDERNGKISVILKKIKDDNFLLRIGDNGIGLPENFNIDKTDSLGMQLIQTLSRQIDSTFSLKCDNGVQFEFNFQGLKYKDL